jgi:hypothetical protein
LWQFYNTAKLTHKEEIECEKLIPYIRERSVEADYCTLRSESGDHIIIDVADGANFVDVKTYITENRDSLCRGIASNDAGSLLAKICQVLHHKLPDDALPEGVEKVDGYPDITEQFPQKPCGDDEVCEGCEDVTIDAESVTMTITDIAGEVVKYTYVRKLDEYANTEKSGVILSGAQGDVSHLLFGDNFNYEDMGFDTIGVEEDEDGNVIDPDDPSDGEEGSGEVEPPFDWREEDPIDPDNPEPPAGSDVEGEDNGSSCIPKSSCQSNCDYTGEKMHYDIINNYLTIFDAIPASSNMGKGRGSAIAAEVYNGTAVLNWGAFTRRSVKLGKYHRYGKKATGTKGDKRLCADTKKYLLGELYNENPVPCNMIKDDSDELLWTESELTILNKDGSKFTYTPSKFRGNWSFDQLEQSYSYDKNSDDGGCSGVFSGISYFRWADRLHKDALWWSIEKPEKEEWWNKGKDDADKFFILEYVGCRNAGETNYENKKIQKTGRDVTTSTMIPIIFGSVKYILYCRDVTTSTMIRITFLRQSAQGGNNFDIVANPFDVDDNGLLIGRAVPAIINTQKTTKVKITPAWFEEERWGIDKVFAVFDTPIVLFGAIFNGFDCPAAVVITYHYCTAMTEGQFSLIMRKPDIDKIDLTFDEMKFSKGITASATCTLCVPKTPKCATVPYAKGKIRLLGINRKVSRQL